MKFFFVLLLLLGLGLFSLFYVAGSSQVLRLIQNRSRIQKILTGCMEQTFLVQFVFIKPFMEVHSSTVICTEIFFVYRDFIRKIDSFKTKITVLLFNFALGWARCRGHMHSRAKNLKRGWSTPLYGLYRYMLLQRVWFFN